MIVLPERFWAKVMKTETCWLWCATTDHKGYGRVWFEGRSHAAHRLALIESGVDLPAAMQADHLCHVRRCVRPDHLRVVDNQTNNQNRRGANSNSRSGIRGVGWHTQHQNWRVRVEIKGRSYSGGSYDDLHEAAAAAVALRERLGVEVARMDDPRH